MSASRMPTLRPRSRRPSERLTAIVDLPTPPFPEATAIMADTPGMPARGDGPGAGPGAAPAGTAPERDGAAAGRCERATSPPPPEARSAVSAIIAERTPGSSRTALSAFARTLSHALTFAASTVMEQNTLPSVTRTSESFPLSVSGAPSGVGTAASFASTSSLSSAICKLSRRFRSLDSPPRRTAQSAHFLFTSYSCTTGLDLWRQPSSFPSPLAGWGSNRRAA